MANVYTKVLLTETKYKDNKQLRISTWTIFWLSGAEPTTIRVNKRSSWDLYHRRQRYTNIIKCFGKYDTDIAIKKTKPVFDHIKNNNIEEIPILHMSAVYKLNCRECDKVYVGDETGLVWS